MTLGPDKQTARIAGFFYLTVVVTGIFSLMYVHGQLIDISDTPKTLQNIRNNEILFRLGIFGSVLCYLAFLVLPLVLYRLLQHVHRNAALLMVALATLSVPISLVATAQLYEIVLLINKQGQLGITDNDLVYMIMGKVISYQSGINTAQYLWALWLFPYGYLVFRSGFLQRFIGIVLMVGSVGYFLDNSMAMLVVGYKAIGISSWLTLPASVGEIGSCLWLLIMGTRESK